MPLPVAAMPLARPISPRFQHHENPSARHAIANQPCGQPAISQHEPDFPRRQYQGEQDRDSEPAAFSASATGFHPARALLHGSFHIGRSIVSPRFRRKQTPRNLSTVIPGAGAAFAAKPSHHDPPRSLAEVKEATNSTAEQAHEETGFGTSPARFRAFIASIGRRITWIRPVVVSINGNWVPATIATSTREGWSRAPYARRTGHRSARVSATCLLLPRSLASNRWTSQKGSTVYLFQCVNVVIGASFR